MLAMGLLAAGVGTMIFLRGAQITALNDQLRAAAPTDLASQVMEVTLTDNVPTFEPNPSAPPSNFVVAVYSPLGELVAVAGGSGTGPRPQLPPTFTLQQTVINGTEPFELDAVTGSGKFHASVDVLAIPGALDQYTQLVALPLAPVTKTVGDFIGIYSALAILVVIAGALGTRSLVTLTFRSLGQVEETAMTIAAGDFGQRMGDIAPGTEVGRLKIAINAMLGRIDAALAQRDATVQQMRRFIGDASHELRTPLVTVRGYAELYRMGAITDAEQTAQAMDRIEKEAKRMGGLVEDLLALARLDERRDLAIAPVDLRPIARDAALDTRAADPDREIGVIEFSDEALDTPTLPTPAERGRKRTAANNPSRSGGTFARLRRKPQRDAEPPDGSPAPHVPPLVPVVSGDENRIRQVVANLIGNARRYSPNASPFEIAVGVDRRSRMGWIAVVDHGEGIPEQLREKIFQRFWRADTSRTRETGGSGLGLSIVASIVEALHGAIEVQGTPGGGATFRVAFPLAESRDAEEHLWIETQPLPRLGELDL